MYRLSCLLLAAALSTSARAEILSVPLESADPENPLALVADNTWSGADVRATRDQWSKLVLPTFAYEAAKGPVRLIVDYAALRPNAEAGDALMDVGIVCPEVNQGCANPITTSVISIRSQYMGEHVARIDGAPTAVWVGRESHSYSFPDGTKVDVWLSLLEHNNLDPKAIRARLVYGQVSGAALPGQATRGGTLLKIAGVVLALTIIVLCWLRRW